MVNGQRSIIHCINSWSREKKSFFSLTVNMGRGEITKENVFLLQNNNKIVLTQHRYNTEAAAAPPPPPPKQQQSSLKQLVLKSGVRNVPREFVCGVAWVLGNENRHGGGERSHVMPPAYVYSIYKCIYIYIYIYIKFIIIIIIITIVEIR